MFNPNMAVGLATNLKRNGQFQPNLVSWVDGAAFYGSPTKPGEGRLIGYKDRATLIAATNKFSTNWWLCVPPGWSIDEGFFVMWPGPAGKVGLGFARPEFAVEFVTEATKSTSTSVTSFWGLEFDKSNYTGVGLAVMVTDKPAKGTIPSCWFTM